MAAVSVLIVNYNSVSQLANALRALATQSFENFEVIVLDNYSTDESCLSAQSAVRGDKRFTFVRGERNLGFAAGNNLAATTASGEWLALLNPDAVPAADWLEQLIAGTRRHPHVVMF